MASPLKWIAPACLTAACVLPFEDFMVDAALQPTAAVADGASTVLVEAEGAMQASAADTDGAVTVLVELSGAIAADSAYTVGTAHARLLVSGALVSGDAEIGGVLKPPPFQTAAEARTGKVYIVEITALERSLTRDVIPWIDFACGQAACVAPDDDIASGEVTFRFSTTGYTSPAAGTLSNTHFEGRVEQPLRITRSFPVVPEGSRRVAMESGFISLINSDAYFDTLAQSHAVDGRKVRVLFGLETYEYDDFTPVFWGSAVAWQPDFNDFSVEVRDFGYRLERPLHTETFLGTGGYEGTASLKGMPRPTLFGEAFNISPVLFDPSNLVYQIHHREIEAVTAVKDRGAALSFDADYADYAALVGASVGSGEYATCLALGLIRTGSTASLLTVDAKGDADGGYVASSADIAQRVLEDFGQVDPSEIDSASLSAFDTLVPGVIHYYTRDLPRISEVLDRVIGHCGGVWGTGTDGRYFVKLLTAPEATDIADYIVEADIIDINRAPHIEGTFPPRAVQRALYALNNTVMTGEDIAGAVSDADRERLSKEGLAVFAKDEQVRTEFYLAREPEPLRTLFRDETDAQAIVDHWLGLLKEQRIPYRVTLNERGYMAPLGRTVHVTDPRINSGNGKLLRVLDANTDAGGETIELLVWG